MFRNDRYIKYSGTMIPVIDMDMYLYLINMHKIAVLKYWHNNMTVHCAPAWHYFTIAADMFHRSVIPYSAASLAFFWLCNILLWLSLNLFIVWGPRVISHALTFIYNLADVRGMWQSQSRRQHTAEHRLYIGERRESFRCCPAAGETVLNATCMLFFPTLARPFT